MLHENILKEASHLNEKIVTGYRTLAREYYSAGEGGTWVNFRWECAAGFSEPLPLIIVYSVANYRPHLSHFWANE